MTACAIDPGCSESAYVLWDGEKILDFGNLKNDDLLAWLSSPQIEALAPTYLAIERIRGYGLPAGNETFTTCEWSGRFFQAFGASRSFWVPRKDVLAHLGIVGGNKDTFVRAALIDRFGGKEKAIGSKRSPGPLYEIHGHLMSALAVALTFWDQSSELRREAHERSTP